MDKAKGKFIAGGLTASIATPEAAFQAPTILTEDREEERRCPVVHEVDGVAPLRAARASNRSPPSDHEGIIGVHDLDLYFCGLP